jgi:hypothetical protein
MPSSRPTRTCAGWWRRATSRTRSTSTTWGRPICIKACTALEVVTEKRPDNDQNQPKFVWQRNGDLRYSFLHWVDRPQAAGPLGYGPSSQDPETGEIVSASAYIYGAALDVYAKFAVDSVRLANQQLSVDDLLSGGPSVTSWPRPPPPARRARRRR